ncbi:tRNA uridine-5-carboxymethylaminomethyl(34) synthesis GTPase MnmE [Sphingomicrobium marinum]|uniref:tRNA uridine-5-carboxymethylaminomethyl(34) synthesis GTPase MnmE n=1 Tax=Sphingomicrobium marinum TaxID=1227950 RepID=UPI00223EA23A|nr:tRNA uridine-5-carboxymethylaminomethyl(34) synthesis GTPase MnmE [Sphingomicrobium marinum]
MTIVALSSGRLPAAIAILRLSGPEAQAAASGIAGALPPPRQASLRDFRHPRTGELIDRGLLLSFPGPNSATGEDLVEFHCHGSRAVVEAMLEALTACPDVRLAQPGEFTRQSLRNGIMDLTEAEGLGDLLEAETEGQRKAALSLLQGGLHDRLGTLREMLIDLSAMAEASIDYVGDEDETSGHEDAIAAQLEAARKEVGRLLELPERRPLRDGVRVVIAGPPNAGKSSLLNALVGSDRAIVSAEAGTTRDVIEVPVRIDGIAYVLADTAGLREASGTVEKIGIDRASGEIERADILLWLGKSEAIPTHPRVIRVAAKSDLGGTAEPHDIAVSSKTGAGVEELLAIIGKTAKTLLPAADGLSLSRHHVAALKDVKAQLANQPDPVLLAEQLRSARNAIDALLGAQGMDDVLDRIFARFCLGK